MATCGSACTSEMNSSANRASESIRLNLAVVDAKGSRPNYHPPSTACPTVGANCRAIARQMLLGVAYVEGAMGRRRIRERDWHTMYPGSRPLGGGSLRPAINPVYDHRLVYNGAAVGGGRD